MGPRGSVGTPDTGHSHGRAESVWLGCAAPDSCLSPGSCPCGSPSAAAGAAPASLHPWYGRVYFIFFSPCVHITCACAKVVFSKTSLFIDDVIAIVVFFWLINCLLSLLCLAAKISHTSSWKGCEETSN